MAGCFFIALFAFHHTTDALAHVGGDEDAHHTLYIAQHVVGTTTHKHTRPLAGSLTDGVGLELEQILLGELVLIEVVDGEAAPVSAEQSAEEPLVLVVLFEDLLREATLLGGEVQDFAVVELAAKLLGELAGDDSSARSQLPAYADDDIVWFIHELVVLISA